MALKKVKLTDAEMSALECNGVFEDIEDRYLPAIITGNTLAFEESAQDRVAEIINDISNTEDAYAEYECGDKESKKFARRAAQASSRLYSKVLAA